eukprot:CAMPEP_0178562584 /NCGR_PEP_ID=MMETSP0697-20121206/12608_1 /TAXON_ID=265572 /ORGANISM="Extubocellulus spinifer, Strain CCMP396" /LENGTH=353 /DNA_ID=CAMNT_0020195937 /DNA_START=20 /DNA_END=1078 /DNA_ORIENTATION=+
MTKVSHCNSRNIISASQPQSCQSQVTSRHFTTTATATRPTRPLLLEAKKTEMIADRIQILLSQESSSSYAVRNYLQGRCRPGQHNPSSSGPVDDTCRLKMVDWLYAIVDTCQLRRSAVPIAMTYVDRLLSTCRLKMVDWLYAIVDTCQLRRSAVPIAMTYVDRLLSNPRTYDQRSTGLANASIEAALGRYSIQDIEAAELAVLTLLGWKVSGPTALDFVDHILAMNDDDASSSSMDESATRDTIAILARMQAELSVADQSLVSVPYSTVAVACIRNAMDEINYPSSASDLQRLCSVMNVGTFSSEIDDVCAHLKQMTRDSANGAVLSRLSSELVCTVPSSKVPKKPTLKREIS